MPRVKFEVQGQIYEVDTDPEPTRVTATTQYFRITKYGDEFWVDFCIAVTTDGNRAINSVGREFAGGAGHSPSERFLYEEDSLRKDIAAEAGRIVCKALTARGYRAS
jgi:hypothetical protein